MSDGNENIIGQLSISKPYFSVQAMSNVIRLTFVKSENKSNGYGISKEFPESTTLGAALLQTFIDEARKRI
ncbi:hypothetical protein JCM19239_5826 [Vibrio variabilis]|uniref:Uncharacterized protein n=1 Tax=Vibrio variabilis TaxID=990271 RepID=A0ABQ0J893_9VIBR|nr:hypothetical protein JCM19239_5826 [Vibrio variabilis]